MITRHNNINGLLTQKRKRQTRRRLIPTSPGIRFGTFLLSAILLTTTLTSLTPTQPSPASAAEYGYGLTLPHVGYVGSYILPNGREAWCIEVNNLDPVPAYHEDLGRISALPGEAGKYHSYDDTAGIRRMNYIMDRYGGTGGWNNAAVQVAIWALRSTGTVDRYDTFFYPALKKSTQGRALLRGATQMLEQSRRNARPPVQPQAVDASLFVLKKDPSGRAHRLQVSYPKGTTQLWTDGSGLFVRNNKTTVNIDPRTAGSRYVDLAPGATKIRVNGSWVSEGVRGWEAKIDAWNSRHPNGMRTQSVAYAAGSSVPARLTGKFGARALKPEPKKVPPKVETQAQPAATVGGVMTDTAIISARNGTKAVMWPDAVLDFTAYLEPVAGAPKMNERWESILDLDHPQTRHRQFSHDYVLQPGEQVIDGFVYGPDYWVDESGDPFFNEAGEKILTVDVSGAPTRGISASGSSYPVQAQDPVTGELRFDAQGAPILLLGHDPVMEQFFLPLTWSESELNAMSDDERCTAQPVYQESGIAVPSLGRYSSQPATVKSEGTVHWVERVSSPAGTHHVGRCGVSNETTRIDQPGVITQAPAQAHLGEEVFDVAYVSGHLAEQAQYSLVFEAYRAPDSFTGTGTETAQCVAQNRVFRSPQIVVAEVGEVRSPGFVAGLEHGTRLWWVESLFVDVGNGPKLLHRGECGLENETTVIERPSVRTQAQENGVVGDFISDTAIVTGDVANTNGVRWEITFEGFSEKYEEFPVSFEDMGSGQERRLTPVCAAENRLFGSGPNIVTGPGEYVSERVVVDESWGSRVWWVETLWLIQNDQRTAVHRGECGLPDETSELAVPSVVTDADAFVVLGDFMRDTAVIEGPLSRREGVSYEVIFEGYRGSELSGNDTAVCLASNRVFETEAVKVSEPGVVRSPKVRALPGYGESIWWVERLIMREGDQVVELDRGECGLSDETTTVQRPWVRTQAAGTVGVGDDMFDLAIVEGPFSEAEGVEYAVTFQAYGRDGSGMSCAPEDEIPELSDVQGRVISEPGRYESKRVPVTEEHVGQGGFVETLTMIVDGESHVVHVGECGEPSEDFEVEPPDLSVTGVSFVTPGMLIGAALLLVGAGVLGVGLRRWRAR